MKLNYIVVDDEPKARKLIELYLENVSELRHVGSFKSPLEAKLILEKEQIDILFLDVEMPNQFGTDFIREHQPDVQVIFCTAYHKFASEAFDLNAIDYVVKPVTKSRLIKAVNKAINHLKLLHLSTGDTLNKSQIISLKKAGKIHLINKNQILYIEAAEDYVKYFLKDEMFMIKRTLKSALNDLGTQFIRVHRSYVINKIAIISISSNCVVLNNKAEIPIGRVYKLALKNVYLN